MTGWIITGVHVVIFLITRKILNKKKRQLEKDKAILTTENQQLKGQIISYKRRLANL